MIIIFSDIAIKANSLKHAKYNVEYNDNTHDTLTFHQFKELENIDLFIQNTFDHPDPELKQKLFDLVTREVNQLGSPGLASNFSVPVISS